jgi:hypothetical protein
MPHLKNVAITFDTHNENKNDDTILHVFVKNRSNGTSTPEKETSFISNLLSLQDHETIPWEYNPYLAYEVNLAEGVEFKEGSSHTYNISLRSPKIPLEEIVLPVVNIHIQPNGSDRWIFSYTITFSFENEDGSDGGSFSASSDTNGVSGIVLDENNQNYSGICIENPIHPPPPLPKPQTDAVLTRVKLQKQRHPVEYTYCQPVE